jgi:hypothetical protein
MKENGFYNDEKNEDLGGNAVQGGQEPGQIDYANLLNDPKALEVFQNSDFFKKAIQSESDKVRTKATNEKKSFEQLIGDQQKEIQELMTFKNESIKKDILVRLGVPVQFWEFIPAGTEEVIKASAEKLLSAHNSLLANEVDKRFRANGSNPGVDSKNSGITKEQFSKMTYVDRARLYQENRELYNELKK